MRALLLALLLACGSPSLAPGDLCSEHAGAWACAPNAVCAVTQRGWVDCLCCTLGADGGWAVTIDNTAADCDQQKREWAQLCPSH